MALVTKNQLENAAQDAGTLETFVNGAASPGTLTTRTGQSLKTLARIQQDVLAAAAVPIWGVVWCGSTGTGIDADWQSGGLAATRVSTGIYKLTHASFTAKTKILITVRGGAANVTFLPLVCNVGSSTAGETFIYTYSYASGSKALADLNEYVTIMTFPQML